METLGELESSSSFRSGAITEVRFVAFDQINRDSHLFTQFSESAGKQQLILFIESEETLARRSWHIQRLFFLLSSARHFAEQLVAEGFLVLYHKANSFHEGFADLRKSLPSARFTAMAPASFSLRKKLESANFEIITNDLFLTTPEEFENWASGKKTLLMENFYRWQRKRLGVLMDGEQPLGGEWNFDHDNRLPPPKNHHYPPYLVHARDEIDRNVIAQLRKSLPALWGEDPDQSWATTRDGALRQMEYFFEHHFAQFGPYEDAMPSADESWQVHHSLLSPYLNNGLLHPREVVSAAIKRFERGDIPIASCEGFIRQVIGWREYVYGIYWLFGEKYRHSNHLGASRKLLPLYREPEQTEMACVRDVVTAVKERAWVHHIPRLMILSNLALLTGVRPIEFLDWMSEVFIDAYDWVMVPNVIGMGVHADGGAMMTKPYAAGGAYISRMSNFCKGCVFDPKKRSGDEACPFTTLYWDFLDRHREEFLKNHRISQQVRGLDRLQDLDQLRDRAAKVLERLSAGTL
jgi:deoxyribodipyrimidine photolyase-related protein